MQATTPLDPRVLDAMLPFWTDQYGNPHSRTHYFGWESDDAVEAARKQVQLINCLTSVTRTTCVSGVSAARQGTAMVSFTSLQPASTNMPLVFRADASVPVLRRQVADLIGADPKEIVFTSGATESNNMALKGVANFYKERKNHIITTQTDHKCVLDSARYLQQRGFEVGLLSQPAPQLQRQPGSVASWRVPPCTYGIAWLMASIWSESHC